MNERIAFKDRLAFLFYENRIMFYLVVAALLFGLFLVLVNTPINHKKVVGFAHSHTYVAGQFGNRPKLVVKLNNGTLAYVSISSPSKVKVGEQVCLSKSNRLIGGYLYRLVSKGACT